jgi:hypothetical protein
MQYKLPAMISKICKYMWDIVHVLCHSVLVVYCFGCRSQAPAGQLLLGVTLVSESHQIMNRIPKQRVVAKTIETA